MSRDSTPTEAAVISGAIDDASDDVFVALPGRIETYDASQQRANVLPLIKRGYRDEADERQVEALPVVPEVPVMFPGTGPYGITWPLAPGDTGLLIFTSASLDLWLHSGDLIDPADDRRQTLTDAVFYPGLRPFKGTGGRGPVGSPGNGPAPSGSAMQIYGPQVHIGGGGALALAADLEALRSALAALTTGPTAPIGTAASSGVTAQGRAVPFVGTSILKGG